MISWKKNNFRLYHNSVSFDILISCVIDGINEKCYPPFGLFAYKTPLLYWLKLIYACLFLFSGVDLLMKGGRICYLMMFSSVGLLTSCASIFINGYNYSRRWHSVV